jgi:uncharacterized protein
VIARAALVLLLLAPVAVPPIRSRVNDLAHVLTPADAAALDSLLADLERTDSTQVVLLTVRTTGGAPIEDYALAAARAAGLGEKKKNNGALVLVAVDDRACRIEVGEGLEGRLPDTIAALIIKHEMVPRLRAGDLSGGVRAGVEAVARAVRGEYKATPRSGVDGSDIEAIFFFAIVLLGIYLRARSYRRGDPAHTLLGGIGWALASSLSSGGPSYRSDSSSASRGFSGGGGRFAGGGASGSW